MAPESIRTARRGPPLPDAVAQGAAALVGRHDLTSFRTSGCSAASQVRELPALDVRGRGSAVDLHFAGDGFLRHMVRNIVRTLVEVGRGRGGDLAEVLAVRDRARAGSTAPVLGLVLERKRYPADAARGSPA